MASKRISAESKDWKEQGKKIGKSTDYKTKKFDKVKCKRVRKDLIIAPSNKSKLRNSAMSTLINAEELKAVLRSKFMRDLIRKTNEYCEKTGIVPMKNRVGTSSVRKIPQFLLDELDIKDLITYTKLLKDLAATQYGILRIMDPFDTATITHKIKSEAKRSTDQTFEELLEECETKLDE